MLKERAADASCEAFERPEYAVKGATPYDQKWANGITEAGVGACKWERPKPRPPELDAKSPVAGAKAPPPAAKPKAPKLSLGARIKRAIVPQAAAAPVTPAAEPLVEQRPVPAITILSTKPVPAAPDDPRDELIGPRGGR
jgi:hypothetical protein